MSKSQDFSQLKIPTHLAIIPDGNRRWAKSNNLPTLEGHKRGSENFEKLIDQARKMGIKFFTGWAFSTENWNRAEEENKYLFNLARAFTKRYKKKFIKEGIRFFHFGRKDRLPKDIVKILNELEEETKGYSDFTVCLAMDYGGHDELVRAVKKLVDSGEEISEENIEKNLDSGKIVPPPDFIIRTSGEQRISGFMSWHSAYAEFYFPKEYFPDFKPENLVDAVKEYTRRDRRFGGDSNMSSGDFK